jgi:hypothetical protein
MALWVTSFRLSTLLRDMRHRLHRSQRSQRRTEGVWLRQRMDAPTMRVRPTANFQYLQLVPMTAIFLAIAALILIMGSVM